MKFEKVFLFVCWLFVAYLIVITVSSCSESDEQLEELSVKTDRYMFSFVPEMPPIQGSYALWVKTNGKQTWYRLEGIGFEPWVEQADIMNMGDEGFAPVFRYGYNLLVIVFKDEIRFYKGGNNESLSEFNPTWKEIFKTTMFNSKIN